MAIQNYVLFGRYLAIVSTEFLFAATVFSQDYDIVILNNCVIGPEVGFVGIRTVGIKGSRIFTTTDDAIKGTDLIDGKPLLLNGVLVN